MLEKINLTFDNIYCAFMGASGQKYIHFLNKEYYTGYVLDEIATSGNIVKKYGININDIDTIDQNIVTFTRMNCFVFKEVKFLSIDLLNKKMFLCYHDRAKQYFVLEELLTIAYDCCRYPYGSLFLYVSYIIR